MNILKISRKRRREANSHINCQLYPYFANLKIYIFSLYHKGIIDNLVFFGNISENFPSTPPPNSPIWRIKDKGLEGVK